MFIILVFRFKKFFIGRRLVQHQQALQAQVQRQQAARARLQQHKGYYGGFYDCS